MKEYLLNNIIDDEFQKMLFPLNLMQSVLLQSKLRIYHRFVTPNGFSAHLKSFLGVILIIGVNMHYFISIYSPFLSKNFPIVLPAFDVAFYSVFSLIIFGVNFVQSQNNVQLVLKMQQAYRLFKSTDGLSKFRKYNWIIIIVILLVYMTFICCHCYRDCSNYYETIFVLSLFYFEGNIIYAIQIIKFLEHEVKLWLVELDRYFVACSEPNHNELMKYLNEIDQQGKRLYAAFVDIMDAFKLFTKVFQYSILLLAIDSFLHPLLFIQQSINLSKGLNNYDWAWFFLVVLLLWATKNFALLIFISVSCQQFSLALAQVEESCAVIGSQHERLYMMDIQKLCKNVLRLLACARADGGLRAGGALAVDAALPLRLLALLATYTVVLLQFAFL